MRNKARMINTGSFYNTGEAGYAKAIVLISFFWISCSKMVKVPEPLNTITTTETFATAANADAAVAGIYNNMMITAAIAGRTSVYPEMSADELHAFGDPSLFETNTLISTTGTSDNFWIAPYYNIYQANTVIEGLQASTTLPDLLKARLNGEAKFLRAFLHFYLVNLYGDVPLVLTSSFETNSLIRRAPVADVYKQIVADLTDAQHLLPDDYSAGKSERIRANAGAATAMLARVYLYTGKWDSAEAQATAVINNAGIYSLVTDLDSTFLKNNSEAIWQLQASFNGHIATSATTEGFIFNPYDQYSSPNFYLTAQLLNAFEPNDLRRSHWVDSTDFNDGTNIIRYFYPYKYKVRKTTADNVSEYSTILRLAEQYLIRAEARAEQNTGLAGAISDLNLIRSRAGLPQLPNSLRQTEVLDAVAQERRIEFFAEYAHRWFDLKRTGRADAVLAPIKPAWKPTAVLYPVPYSELQTNPNLVQNPGYSF